MYKQEFPDRDFEDRDRQIAANIKSKLRREFKIGRRRRKRGRPAGSTAAGAGANAAPRAGRPASSLPMLEDHIDECLMLAKRLDREGLDDVIKHLRRARNIVVVKLGEQ
jgi:DNA-binding MurR/RpiR family transcriptional regulator